MNEQCLVNATEAARQLGMAKSSLYRMASSGIVPSYAVGMKKSGVRFDVEEVRQALRSQNRPNDLKPGARVTS